jgi:hypothetical protein
MLRRFNNKTFLAMKTNINSRVWALLVAGMFMFAVNTYANPFSEIKAKQDTLKSQAIAGKVVDNKTNKPVIFTSVYVVSTNIGTVTNSDGDFVIKIPKDLKDVKLGFSNVGYKNYEVAVSELSLENNVIKLAAAAIPIAEVQIRSSDPLELLRAALKRVNENYYTSPEGMTAFYRETIKENKNYVAISEAVLDIYKAPYNRELEIDRVKIFKGRKSQDVKKMDTVIFKLQGGPTTMVLLDVVKNPNILIAEEMFEYYDYKLIGVLNIDDRQNYVIEFDQKVNVDYPLYSGKIFLDVNNLAITGLEFNLSERGIDKAANVLVRKKPLTMKIEPLGAYYLVNYREENGNWYLNHVRTELVIKCKWKKRLFNKTFTAMSEMAVTNKTRENVVKPKSNEITKPSDVFTENVAYEYDEDFWGEYNYIKPEESIENAVERINKKMRKRLSSIE